MYPEEEKNFILSQRIFQIFLIIHFIMENIFSNELIYFYQYYDP